MTTMPESSTARLSTAFDLAGRRAIVTGASRGIGRAIARGFAELGADVLAVARSADGLAETAQSAGTNRGSIVAHAADLRHEESILESVDAAVQAFGGLDIVVNNAADDHDGPIEETELAVLRRVLELNVESYWLMAKAASPHLAADGGGKLINVASMLGTVGVRENSTYIASKHAVVGITRALAVEWGRRNVQVNALAPGFVQTAMTRHALENEGIARWITRNTPMGRWSQPEEMVGPVVFLASSASDFVTGQVLVVDGGWTAQ